ncbi:MAG: mismatch-specific DNA-glycosylase [Bacteroidales bacterium]|nr:mismatch-specific DNA-glycosylase [Bacteroidales bacterium]
MKLQDLLKNDLKVVFCGTSVGNRSAQQEAYYAGCGNKFYCILFQAEFTPVQLIPTQYRELLHYGIGLTDLVKLKSGVDKDLSPEDFDIMGFKEKISKYKPRFVCFNGKAAAKAFSGNHKVEYGLQSYTQGTTRFFVAPSTSPTAHNYWDERFWKN